MTNQESFHGHTPFGHSKTLRLWVQSTKVQSESDPEETYGVDLNIGICTCITGNNGAICTHQVVRANHGMTVVPQMLVLNSGSRHWLAVLGLWEEKPTQRVSFKSLKEVQSGEITQENNEADIDGNSFPDNCSDPMQMKTPDVMSASITNKVHTERGNYFEVTYDCRSN